MNKIRSLCFSLALIFSLTLILFTLSACITTKAVKLGDSQVKRPPVPADQVVVYRTADQVPGRYEEIALLYSSGDAVWIDVPHQISLLKKEAGKMGANAIILDAMSEPSDEEKVLSVLLGLPVSERVGKAIAIYVFR